MIVGSICYFEMRGERRATKGDKRRRPSVRRPNNKLFEPPVRSMTLTLDVCQVTLPKIAARAIFSPKSTRATFQSA